MSRDIHISTRTLIVLCGTAGGEKSTFARQYFPRDAQRAGVAEEAGHFLLASAKLTGMVQQHIFASQDVPERFKCQILSFVRIQWPELFSGKDRLRDWTSKPELHPVTFLLEEEGVLISRLEVVWDVLAHAGETYIAYGLSGVFTYPAFRKQGYGLQLVQSVKASIEQQAEADLVLFHSTLKGFYEQAGFERMDSLVTLVGDPLRPERSPETAFMLFLSDKGKRGRSRFENTSVYVGESIW